MSALPGGTHQRVLLLLVYVALGTAAGYLFFKYLFRLLLPFILAWLLAALLEPAVRLLTQRFHLRRGLAACGMVLSSVALLVTLLYYLGKKLLLEAAGLGQTLLHLMQDFPQTAAELSQRLVDALPFLPGSLAAFLLELPKNLFNGEFSLPPALSSGAFSAGLGVAKSIPSAFLFVVVFLVASILVSSDWQKVNRTLVRLLPPSGRRLLAGLKDFLSSSLVKYLKAQLVLMSITSLELLVGFLILRVDYALALALVIAIIDALPILGTGTVLIPWALYKLLMGQPGMALGLAILYGVILLVRQMLEPKIVGASIGLHPLLTLFSIYVGMGLFGFVGMIAGPILTLLLTYLWRDGYFKWLWEYLSGKSSGSSPS